MTLRPMQMLRLVNGVVLNVVVIDFVGVDAVIGETFSVSELESPAFW